jgi:hypothetical protein
MNIAGSMASIGYPAVAPSAVYRTDRAPLPESTPDASDEASLLASAANTTVSRRSESVAQVESELSRQLTVSQATGTEGDGATSDAKTTTDGKRPTSAIATPGSITEQRPPHRPTSADAATTGQLSASAQLAVTQYQAHQSLLETSSDTVSNRLSITA